MEKSILGITLWYWLSYLSLGWLCHRHFPPQHLPSRVLCSTFPLYQITRNVVAGRDSVRVQLMIPAQLGCPHDYVLTPQDMQKLAKADVLIVNGLGMEEFLGAPVAKANPPVFALSTAPKASKKRWHTTRDHEEEHPEQQGHHQRIQGHADQGAAMSLNITAITTRIRGVNPHLFASPQMVAKLALNIATELGQIDPEGAAIYAKNAQAYAARMNKLGDELAALGQTLKSNRIVTQHGVFDYLARDMGLEVVAVVQAHAGQEPSAAEMLEIIKITKEKKAGAVFTEPQYPAKIGQTIAKEAGIPMATLDPVANGPKDAGTDYYEKVMRRNLETLKKTLGTK